MANQHLISLISLSIYFVLVETSQLNAVLPYAPKKRARQYSAKTKTGEEFRIRIEYPDDRKAPVSNGRFPLQRLNPLPYKPKAVSKEQLVDDLTRAILKPRLTPREREEQEERFNKLQAESLRRYMMKKARHQSIKRRMIHRLRHALKVRRDKARKEKLMRMRAKKAQQRKMPRRQPMSHYYPPKPNSNLNPNSNNMRYDGPQWAQVRGPHYRF